MYKTRDITNFKTAKTALDLLTSNNDINKFQSRFTKITQLTTKNTDKVKIKTYTKNQTNTLLETEILTKVYKVINTPDNKNKNKINNLRCHLLK